MATRGADNRYTFAHTQWRSSSLPPWHPDRLAPFGDARRPCGWLHAPSVTHSRAFEAAAGRLLCRGADHLFIFCSAAFCVKGCAFVCLVVLLYQMQ